MDWPSWWFGAAVGCIVGLLFGAHIVRKTLIMQSMMALHALRHEIPKHDDPVVRR